MSEPFKSYFPSTKCNSPSYKDSGVDVNRALFLRSEHHVVGEEVVRLEFAGHTEHELAAGPGALEVYELLVKEGVKVEERLVLGRGQTMTTSVLLDNNRRLGEDLL